MADTFIPYPEAQDDDTVYSWSAEELAEIERHKAKYPEQQSAVMPLLWMAQEKWGWLPQGAMQLVADSLDMSFADVYGVATFYTMYLKENKAKHLVEVCTCFTCGVTSGPEVFEKLKAKFNADEHGVSQDGQFYFREAECLGACDSAPVAQLDNRRLVFNASVEKMVAALAYLSRGEAYPLESVPLANQQLPG